jgi:hypothetical protein
MKFALTLPLLVCAGALLIAAVAMPTATSAQSAPGTSNTRPPASGTEGAYRAAAESADRKFHKIQTNALKAHPDQTPAVFTERELNAYMAGGYVKLPEGVSRVRFSGSKGTITTSASVDFDKVTQGKTSSNPLMAIFSGIHDVEVVSHGQGSGGQAIVHIDSVALDGVTVPRLALQFFVDRYIKPKHPDLGLDSRFELPDRIDTASVGDHVLILTQK